MFNTYITNTPDHSPALRQIARSYDNLGEIIRDTSEAEIKSKDRVDITLEEYLAMRKRTEELESSNRHIQSIFDRMGPEISRILSDESIPVEEITTEYSRDSVRFKRYYSVIFRIDENDLRMRGL